MRMMTERLRAAVARADSLPPEDQDRIVRALNELIDQASVRRIPSLAPEVRAAVDRAIQEHAESLEYLKDR